MINLSDINATEIMIGAIASVIVGEIWNVIKIKYSQTQPIKKLKNIKAINGLWFFLVYILPLSTIVFLVFGSRVEPNFQNIALFIIICVSLIFNILMSHIRTIYKMISELTSKSFDNDSVHQKAINIIFEHIGKNERIK